MEIANGWLYINKMKSDVPKKNMTPAELTLLIKEWQDVVGTFPVHDLEIIGTVKRSSEVEKQRLANAYGQPRGAKKDTPTKIDSLYPGANAKLPESFADLGETILKQAKNKTLGEPVPHPDDVKPEPIVLTPVVEETPASEPTTTEPAVAPKKVAAVSAKTLLEK